MIMHVVADETS